MDSNSSPSSMLFIAGVVLTEWLLIVAEMTGQFQYYFWAFVVVVAWSEAEHTRFPYRFKSRAFRILYFFLTYYVLFFVINKTIIYIQQNGLRIPGTGFELLDWLAFLL